MGPSPPALLMLTLWRTWSGFSPGWSLVTYVDGKTPTAPKHFPFHQSLSELSISVSFEPALKGDEKGDGVLCIFTAPENRRFWRFLKRKLKPMETNSIKLPPRCHFLTMLTGNTHWMEQEITRQLRHILFILLLRSRFCPGRWHSNPPLSAAESNSCLLTTYLSSSSSECLGLKL